MIELKQERLLCLLAFAATSACTYMYVTFGSCDKIGLPGAGLFVKSPVGVAKKYPINNDPSEIMVGMAWIMSFLSNQLSTLYLLVIQRQCKLFPPVFYLCWIAGGVLSLTWTYTYSQEMHLASAIIVGCVYVLAPFQLAVGVKYFTENHFCVPEKLKTGLQRVLDSVGIMMTWTCIAMASTLTYPLVYEHSAHLDTAIRVDWISESTATLIGLSCMFAVQIVWTFLDIFVCPKYTSCLQSIYPMFIFGEIGLFLANYSWKIGMTQSNSACLVFALFASLTLLLREKFHGTLPKKHMD